MLGLNEFVRTEALRKLFLQGKEEEKSRCTSLDEVSGLRLEGRDDLEYIKCWSLQSFPDPALLDPSLNFACVASSHFHKTL